MNKSTVFAAPRIHNGFSYCRLGLSLVAFVCSLYAPLTGPASAQSTARLQPLLNDTVAQLKLVYRHDANELHRRYEQVSKVLMAWRASDRSAENNRRLEAWLRTAIRSSMPGSHQPLPPMPEFENRPAPVPATPSPEHSLMPAASGSGSPTITKRTPTAGPIFTQPLRPAEAPAAKVETSKPGAEEPTTAGGQTADESEPSPADENSSAEPLPGVGEPPEIEHTDAPDLGELPEPDELPEIVEDPAMVEALGDPFVDDPANTE